MSLVAGGEVLLRRLRCAAALRDNGALAPRKRQNTSWGDVVLAKNERTDTHEELSSSFIRPAPPSPLVGVVTTRTHGLDRELSVGDVEEHRRLCAGRYSAIFGSSIAMPRPCFYIFFKNPRLY